MAPATLGILTFDKKGRTTFTESMRRELDIDECTYVVVERTERGTIELVPATLVPKNQLRFHNAEMQGRIAQAEAGFAEGRSMLTTTIDEARALLERFKSQAMDQGTTF